MKVFIPQPPALGILVSVVVALRNEEKNIEKLLKAISGQTFQDFELIFINDHSNDNTVQIYNDFKLSNSVLLNLPEDKSGKKEALKYGILKSKGELIVTTDADCIPGINWLETIVAFYEKEKPEFIIAPVRHSTHGSLLQKLFAVDFMSLQAAGAGAAEIQVPFLCNGANLAFTKLLWENSQADATNSYASGDDTFLLHTAVKKYPPEKIRYLFSEKAIITTPAPISINNFFNQRVRWTSKSKGYKNSMSRWASIAVLLLVFTMTFLLFGSFFSKTLFYCFLGLIVTKTIVEIPLMYQTAKFYKEEGILRYFLLLQLIYFLYTFFIAMYSVFGRFTWKGRTINK
jgi:glycosyltransferase involved in cell wall biosynthesis